MENQTQLENAPVRSNRTLIIVVIAAIVLCCCVVIGAVALYSLTANSSSNNAPQQQPAEEFLPSSNPDAGVPPNGGLGNDILKNDVWDLVKLGAASTGCQQPSGMGLEIEVLQQPGSGGVWVEKWPVRCASGDVKEFEVEFVPDDTGVVFNIRLLP